MTQERRTVSFTIDEPFDVSLRILRRALAREGLRIPSEVDTSASLKAALGIDLKSSIVLYVDTPMLLLETTVLSAAGALYVPEPVVLSGSGKGSAKECTVVVRSIKPILDDGLSNSVRAAIMLLHERILKAIQTIGHREPVLQYTDTNHQMPA